MKFCCQLSVVCIFGLFNNENEDGLCIVLKC